MKTNEAAATNLDANTDNDELTDEELDIVAGGMRGAHGTESSKIGWYTHFQYWLTH